MQIKNRFDLFIVIPLILILFIGIMMIYSVTNDKNIEYFNKQIIWIIFSILIFIAFQFIPIKVFLASSYLFFTLNIFLLLFVKLINLNQVERWINIGFFYIQPSEFAKFFLVLALGRFLSYRINEINSKSVLFSSLLIVALPFLLVFIQPDLGTAIIFIMILIIMLILSGARFSYIFILLSPVISIFLSFIPMIWIFYLFFMVIVLYRAKINVFSIIKLLFLNIFTGGLSPLLWGLLKEYQRVRILSFLYPQKDIHGIGWNLLQSKIAVGSGGFLGKGFMQGTQKGLDFIPQQHTDFIFSVIGEELGFLGFIVLSVLVFTMFIRVMYIYSQIRNKYSALIAGTFISIILFQILMNIAMTIGLIPIVGLPLCFISYGGSNLITSMAMLAVVNKIVVERFNYW